MNCMILIVGLGKSGRSVAMWCKAQQQSCCLYDDDREKAISFAREYGFQTFGDAFLASITTCVLSPGVQLSHPVVVACREMGVEVISEVEFALRIVKDNPPKMIAVTGTNGKTTVVELVTHIFLCAGRRCEAIGNIGRPFLDAFQQADAWPDWYIVELSSFQLMTTSSPLFTIGCWLNLSANHLDWHSSMDEYARAKQHLAQLVKKEGLFLYHTSIPTLDVPVQARVCRFGENHDDLPGSLLGGPKHDIDNYLAAKAVCLAAGIDAETIKNSYATFTKPHHRIEFVATIDGISYWDDSKGTNIAATAAAVAAMKENTVLIAGGVHKGASYAPWRKTFPGKVVSVMAIGQAKELIAADIGDVIPVRTFQTLEEAVLAASKVGVSPYAVLLSPGCSSLDMFRDYKERGIAFQNIVRSLRSEAVCQ